MFSLRRYKVTRQPDQRGRMITVIIDRWKHTTARLPFSLTDDIAVAYLEELRRTQRRAA